MTNEIVKVNASDYGLDETKAQEITKGLKTILAERETLKEQYKECIEIEITQDSIPRYKELRLMIRDNRTKGIEIWHKNNKAYFLAGGNFVDAIKRKEVAENEYMEEKLLNAEKYFENLEHDRIEKLRVERLALLKPYTDIEPLAVANMEQSVFDNLLVGFKLAYESRISAEKKAEEDRIAKEKAEAEEREKQRLENIRLRREAEERERLVEIERKKQIAALAYQKAKAERERRELLEKARVEQERVDKQLAAERAKAEALRNERERLEKSIADRKTADEKAKREVELKVQAEARERKAVEKKAALAPDKTKLLNFMQSINDLPRPGVKSIEAADIASKANIYLVQCANFIRDNANKL